MTIYIYTYIYIYTHYLYTHIIYIYVCNYIYIYIDSVTSRKSTAAFLYCTIWAVVFTTVLSCILEHVLRLLRCDLDPTDRRDDG